MSHLHHPTPSTPGVRGPLRWSWGQAVKRDPLGQDRARVRQPRGRSRQDGFTWPRDAAHGHGHHLPLLGTQFGASLLSVPTNWYSDGACTRERG